MASEDIIILEHRRNMRPKENPLRKTQFFSCIYPPFFVWLPTRGTLLREVRDKK